VANPHSCRQRFNLRQLRRRSRAPACHDALDAIVISTSTAITQRRSRACATGAAFRSTPRGHWRAHVDSPSAVATGAH